MTATTRRRALQAAAAVLATGTSGLWAASADRPLKVCLLSGSFEYESDKTLADFQQELETRYPVEARLLKAPNEKQLPGLEALDDADLMVLYTRRITLPEADLERVKRYLLAGRPIVGIRTASHAFQNWLELDKLVLGGNYKGHFGRNLKTSLTLTEAGDEHATTRGFKPFESSASLYRNTGVADDVTVLMNGSIPEHTEPVSWVRRFREGRVFYTSLGGQADFREPAFRAMLTAAVFWAAGRQVPEGVVADESESS